MKKTTKSNTPLPSTLESNTPLPSTLEAYYAYTYANACSRQGYVALNHLHAALRTTWEEGTKVEEEAARGQD